MLKGFTSILYAVDPWHPEVLSACYVALRVPHGSHANGVSRLVYSSSVGKAGMIMRASAVPGSLDCSLFLIARYLAAWQHMQYAVRISRATWNGLHGVTDERRLFHIPVNSQCVD